MYNLLRYKDIYIKLMKFDFHLNFIPLWGEQYQKP